MIIVFFVFIMYLIYHNNFVYTTLLREKKKTQNHKFLREHYQVTNGCTNKTSVRSKREWVLVNITNKKNFFFLLSQFFCFKTFARPILSENCKKFLPRDFPIQKFLGRKWWFQRCENSFLSKWESRKKILR